MSEGTDLVVDRITSRRTFLTQYLLAAASVLIAYLIGSIPSGYVVARVRGVNIQQVGSGNIGVTNVLRSVGVLPAVLVGIADPLKGAIAVLLPQLLGLDPWIVAASGLAVVVGNNYNIFLKFRGGKGVATSIGVMLAIYPVVALLSVAVGIYAIALGRFVSLGSLVGIFAAPLFLIVQGSAHPAYLWMTIALTLLATWRHRDNLVRLARGTENRLGRKKSGMHKDPADVAPPEKPQAGS